MVTRLKVEKASLNNGQLQLEVNEWDKSNLLTDGERMLVDAEQLSFIYILEHKGEFVHLSIEKEIWPIVKEALKEEASVKLFIEDDNTMILNSFHSELNYLIENIKGNSNYGEEMVQNVEEIF